MAVPRLPGIKIAICALVLLCAGGAAFIFSSLRHARRELASATKEVAREGQFRARTISLAGPSSTGFEPIGASISFSDAAVFKGKLYLCGPSGVTALDQSGRKIAEYRVGQDLPPAPLERMAAGLGPGGAGPQLWIATRGQGLLAFDGSGFHQILPEKPTARKLTAVLPLATGRILLGSEQDGVLVWDGKSLERFHPALDHLRVTALAGSATDLWVGTMDRGVVHWHSGEVATFNEENGLPDNRVLSLAVTPGNAYVGTAVGVAEFQDGRPARSLAPGVFAKSLLVEGGKLAIGTLEEGVVELTLQAAQPRPRAVVARSASGLAQGAVSRIFSIDGEIYTLAEDGLYVGERRAVDNPGAVLSDGNISALDVDIAGRLWVGYFDRGLDIVDAAFARSAHYQDDRLFCVNRIVHEQQRGLTAVATANGLVMFDASGARRQTLTRADGLIADNVTDVLFHASGSAEEMILATPAGLTTIGPSGTTSLYAFHGLVNNHAYTLAASGDRLLAGTLGGLSVLDRGVVRTNYTTANSGLKQNWITAIEPSGSDWFVGTYGAGVLRLDSTGRWSGFPDLLGQIEINTNAMAATPRAIYAGTLDQGLAVYNRASGRWSFVTRGLPSSNVTALAAAGGSLYVGTDNGLVRIAEQQVPMP